MFKSLRQLHWSIYTLALASGVIMTGFMMLLPLLPEYALRQGFSEYDIGLLVAAFFIGRVLFQFPLGILSDHIGRKAIISASLLLFTVTTMAYALTADRWVMMFLRLLQGVAASGFAVGSQSFINDQTPTEFRGLANGVMSSAINMGVIVGPLLGGTLSQAYNLQTPFWVGGTLGGLCFLLNLAVPKSVYGKKTGPMEPTNLLDRGKSILASVFCLPSFSLSVIHFMIMMSIAIFLTSAPILTAEILGWSSREIAIAFAAGGATAAFSSPFLGRLADMAGRIRILALGIASLLLEGLVVFFGPGTIWMIAAFALGGAGTPAYFNAFYSLLGDATSPQERGAVTGFVGSFGEWGSILGSSLIVPLTWSSINVRAPMAADVAVLLLTLVFAFIMKGALQKHVGKSRRINS